MSYEVLNYAGDVSGAEGAQPGRLLGFDEMFQPWEVIDAEHDRDGGVHPHGVTTVNVQPASRENLLAGSLRLEQEHSRAQVQHARLVRAGLVRSPEQQIFQARVLVHAAEIRASRERRAER